MDDTYWEAFSGVFTRFIITAGDKKRLKRAAYLSTTLPSTVFGKSQGSTEDWLDPTGTIIFSSFITQISKRNRLHFKNQGKMHIGII